MIVAAHKKREPWSPEAIKAVLDYRQGGLTLKAIGEKFNVGKERIRQVISKEERLQKRARPKPPT